MDKKSTKDTRLYLRISTKKKKDMLEYAERNDVYLSDLVGRFFDNLLAYEKKNKDKDKRVPESFF